MMGSLTGREGSRRWGSIGLGRWVGRERSSGRHMGCSWDRTGRRRVGSWCWCWLGGTGGTLIVAGSRGWQERGLVMEEETTWFLVSGHSQILLATDAGFDC